MIMVSPVRRCLRRGHAPLARGSCLGRADNTRSAAALAGWPNVEAMSMAAPPRNSLLHLEDLASEE
jgi:hypothetical protein